MDVRAHQERCRWAAAGQRCPAFTPSLTVDFARRGEQSFITSMAMTKKFSKAKTTHFTFPFQSVVDHHLVLFAASATF
jgi:hypothetical protein